MPIKDTTIYPKYWKQFSAYIRFERAESKCEECGIEHGWLKIRYKERRGNGGMRDGIFADTSTLSDALILNTAKVCLTVAHLNADGDVCDCQVRTGFLCANPKHVKAMCQQCHNRYDSPMRKRNARETTRRKKDAERSLFA